MKEKDYLISILQSANINQAFYNSRMIDLGAELKVSGLDPEWDTFAYCLPLTAYSKSESSTQPDNDPSP